MSKLTPVEIERLQELLADEGLEQLSVEDRAELEGLRLKAGITGGAAGGDDVIGRLLVVMDKRAGGEAMPASLRAAVQRQGQRMMTGAPVARIGPARRGWWAAAAAVAFVAASVAIISAVQRGQRLASVNQQLAVLQAKVQSNESELAAARTRADRLASDLAAAGARATDQDRRLAEAADREVRLAEQLADATRDLDSTRVELAKLTEPVDPATLQQNRQLLLEVPGTVRLAWQPFDLPDAPAEQRLVSGDVIWNDEREEGYLRFVGLAVNDPAVEQYQVWVIDERGMEQKVSGGVFNATAEGEVIVPIHPGIDVRRVKLFAVTIEEPGGTWVPDLKRRVVVAPRET